MKLLAYTKKHHGLGYKIKDHIILDDEDYDRCAKIAWHDNGNGYVRGRKKINGEIRHILLHRYVMYGDRCVESGGMQSQKIIDHINGNKKDNRKENLRTVDRGFMTNIKNFRIPEGYMTQMEAARYLGYRAEASIYHLYKQGKIKRYKIVTTPIYKKSDLDKLLALKEG